MHSDPARKVGRLATQYLNRWFRGDGPSVGMHLQGGNPAGNAGWRMGRR
jgi:hypothetical protein